MDLNLLKYTRTHEWLKLDGTHGTVGITQHAQEEISDVVFVELPKRGKVVKQGEETAVVESVKSAFSIYAPVSGTVVKVNDSLTQDPGLINRSPYEKGWIFILDAKNPSEPTNLLDQHSYDEWVKGGGH